MDSLVLLDLFTYAIVLAWMVVATPSRRLAFLPVIAIGLRAFALCLRQNLGTDVDNYTTLLTTCDLSSVNAIELFWYPACLPSWLSAGLLPFPFLWVGALDCALFWWMLRAGGWRVAGLHDLVYLPTQELGAIRQAIAMKLIVIAVLLYMQSRGRRTRERPLRLLAATPFVHLAAIVPLGVIRFMTARLPLRLAMLGATALAGTFALSMIDATLIGKLQFYLEFEGFRSAGEIYASWGKRVFVVVGSMALVAAPALTWLLYAVAMAFAATEFWVPEIAVRVGAYFEQFEVFLVGSTLRPGMRRYAPLWYGFIALAYTARYTLNVAGLPR